MAGAISISVLVRDLLEDGEGGLQQLDPANHFNSRATSIDIISGGNIMIWVGPPLEKQALKYPRYLKPIGTCTAFSGQEARNWIPVTEFGEQHVYRIPGKMQLALNISRIQTAAGDLYRTLYSWLQKHWGELQYDQITWHESPSIFDETGFGATEPGEDGPTTGAVGKEFFVGAQQIKNPSSELLMMPFGLLMVQFDQGYNIVKKQYAENCKISGKSWGFNPNSPMVEESGTIFPFRICPTLISVSMKAKTDFNIADATVVSGAGGGNGAGTTDTASSRVNAAEAGLRGDARNRNTIPLPDQLSDTTTVTLNNITRL
jgi:hypothetical protein